MRRQLLAAVRLLALLTLVVGVAYPLVVTGIAQAAFPHQADGSLVVRDGRVVGSELLGQAFTGPTYFHPRPSAAGPLANGTATAEQAGDLSLSASGASNQGPSNPDLLAAVAERAAAYRADNGLAPDVPLPVDAVTASGSGVDPHISLANARLQAPRVAEARGLALEAVLALVDAHVDGRSLGFLGEPGVNVLGLNLALDDRAG